MVKIALTGANGDVGYEVLKQRAAVSEITHLVVTCRTAEKCNATTNKLIVSTGKDRSFFSFVALDLCDLESVTKAVVPLKVSIILRL